MDLEFDYLGELMPDLRQLQSMNYRMPLDWIYRKGIEVSYLDRLFISDGKLNGRMSPFELLVLGTRLRPRFLMVMMDQA
jgi:hypothetical protein